MKAQLAFLAADGIGQEVLRKARQVLETIAHEHNHTFDWIGRIMDIQTIPPVFPRFWASRFNGALYPPSIM